MRCRIFVLFLVIPIYSIGQITWCPPGALWHSGYYSLVGDRGYVEIRYDLDTLVSGVNCKKLIEHKRYKDWYGQYIYDHYQNLYTYESAGVVFMFNLISGSNNWDTLYNFNTPINGSWYINSSDSAFITVYDSGSKIINSDTLQWRAIEFVYPSPGIGFSDTLFERIGLVGPHYGFINPWMNYGLKEPSIHGLCNYLDSSFPLYGSPDSICLDLPAGFEEMSGIMQAKVFPNPFHDQLTIELSQNLEGTLFLFNSTGQIVLSKSISVKSSLDTKLLTEGIYYYQLKNENKIIAAGKLVKE